MRSIPIHFLTEIQFGGQFFSCLPGPFPKTLASRLQKNCERCRYKLKEHQRRALFARMTYSRLHPQDDPLIEPVPSAVFIDPRVPLPRVRPQSHPRV
jgi:hypothetical protein